MGTALTGNTIASSYLGLLKSTDSLAIGGTKKIITDGAGNNLPFGISTSSFTFNAGAVDVPTLSIGTINEGFYQPADETIGVTVNGTEVARFSTTGLSLTSNGSTGLFVNRTTSDGSIITLQSSGTAIGIFSSGLSGSTKVLKIDSNTSDGEIRFQTSGQPRLQIKNNGQLQFNNYGGGSITGTVTQRLGVTSSGQVVEIPIGAGALDGSGTAGKLAKFTDSDTLGDSLLTESTNSVSLADNKELILGNDSDLTIKHSSTGNQNLIKSDTHQLFITSDVGMELADNGGKSYFEATEGGSSRLFFNNSKKIETTNTGADITGTITTTGSVSVGDSITLADNNKIKLGSSADLEIFHSGDDSFIKDVGTGSLFIDTDGTAIQLTSSSTSKNMLRGIKDGAVELYHNNSKRLETTSTGINVTGDIIAKEGVQSSKFETDGNDLVLSANTTQTNVSPNIIFKSSVSGGSISERMRIDSGGRLGLKESSPTTFLDVRGDSTALPTSSGTSVSAGTRTRLGSTATSTLTAVLDFGIGTSSRAWIQSTDRTDLSAINPLLLNPNGGNVGINTGTNTPSVALDVGGDATFTGNLFARRGSFGTASNFNFDLYNNGISYFNGEVTIDDSASVSGDLLVGKTSNDISVAGAKIGASTGSNFTRDSAEVVFVNRTTDNGKAITIAKDGTAVGVIGTEKWGIGTATPAFASGSGLEIQKAGIATLRLQNSNSKSVELTQDADFKIASMNSSSNILFIPTENVGIGNTNPQAKLHITGTENTDDTKLYLTENNSLLGGYFKYNGDANINFIGGLDTTEKPVIRFPRDGSELRFLTSSSERMRLDSNGNVGIGVEPETDWHSTYKALQLNTASAFASYGSGTTFGTVISTNQRTVGNTFVQNNKYIASAPAQLYLQDNSGNHIWYNAPSGTEDDTITWSERMVINSSGFVGIGTTSPKHYSGTTGTVLSLHSATHRGILELSGASNSDEAIIGAITFANTENTSANGALSQIFTYTETSDSNAGDDSGGHLAFLTRPEAGTITERMRIDSSGQITNTMSGGTVSTDINGHITSFQTLDTATAGGRFIGKSNRGVLGSIHIEQTTTSADGGYIGFETSPSGSTTPTERMRISSGGEIQVGNAVGGSDVDTGTRISATQMRQSNAGTGAHDFHDFYRGTEGSLSRVGNIRTTGTTTAYNTSSDYRLKEDLQDFNALEIASKIKMYDFKWKADDSRSYGVMAHELQEVLPQAVAGEKDAINKDGTINPQGVDYSKLVPILLKSIQELEARVQELEKEI